MKESQVVNEDNPSGKLRQPARRRRLWWILGILGGVIILAAVYFGVMSAQMNNLPAGLDFSTTRLSDQKVYRVSFQSIKGSIDINEIHSWKIHVETPDGKPVENATINVDGGMPQHGHGLPTRPQVTSYMGNGDYLVEGMKFQMYGWWEVKFQVASGEQKDTVVFNLNLKQ